MKNLPLSTTRTLLAASSKSKGDPEGLRSKVKSSPSASVHCISADITELTSKNNYKGHHYNKPSFSYIYVKKKDYNWLGLLFFGRLGKSFLLKGLQIRDILEYTINIRSSSSS